jgi:polysaccharide biosynthesis protein PslH
VRILFVVPYVPNLIRVRPYNLIRYLTAAGHEVTVLTLWSNEAEREDATALAAHCYRVIAVPLPRRQSLWSCLLALPQGLPLQSAYCWQPSLARELATSGQNGQALFDVIHVEHLRGARYGLHYRRHRANGAPVIWDSVDCISHLFRQTALRSQSRVSRWLARLELGRTERYEAWLASYFERVMVTSPADKTALEQLSIRYQKGVARPVNVTVLPNGVDLDYFQPGQATARDAATLVISGKMSYHANVTMALHFLEAVMPHVWALRPEVRLNIVGKDPPRRLLAAARRPNVTVTGAVADIRPYLQRATIAVAPILYGAGIQNKVLEAMACATPVVATPQAVSALQVVPGRDLMVAERPAEIAGMILSLLSAPESARQCGWNGRCYVEKHHHWAHVARQLEDTYTSAIAARSSARRQPLSLNEYHL